MKSYLVDTNIFVRYFTESDSVFTKKSKDYFAKARDGKIKIEVSSEILLEIEYVLRKVYKVGRILISEKLLFLAKTPYFDIQKRNLWIKSLELYSNTNFDLVDIFLWAQAEEKNIEVLSFDKDFEKLKKFKSKIMN